ERRFGAAEGLAVDIAEGMLRHARARGGASHFIGGDAERLPLRDGSCALGFASRAMQGGAALRAVRAEAG
ncbi:methyltransferase domain-containing protein, partial [Pseudomonas aeruginosa]